MGGLATPDTQPSISPLKSIGSNFVDPIFEKRRAEVMNPAYVAPEKKNNSVVLSLTDRKINEPSTTHKVVQGVFDFVKTVGSGDLNAKKIGQSLIAGAKTVPGTIQQAGGIILSTLNQQKRAIDNFFKPINNALLPKQLEDFRNNRKDLENKVTEDIALNLREKGTQSMQKVTDEYSREKAPSTGFQNYLELAAFNLPQMATNVGLTLATTAITKNPWLASTVGMSTSFGLGASEVYNEARRYGLSDKQALPLAQYGGAIIGAIDFVPLVRLIEKTGAIDPIEKAITNKIAKAIVSMGIEAGMEGITEGIQEIVGNSVAQTYNEKKDLFEGVSESAVVGTLLGGFTDVTVSGVMGVVGRNATPGEVLSDINNKVEKAFNTPAAERTTEQKQIVQSLLSNNVTPDEAMSMVIGTELEKTEVGREIIKNAVEAKKQDMNMEIILSEDQSQVEIKLTDKLYRPELIPELDSEESIQEIKDKIRIPETFANEGEEKSLKALKEDPIRFRDAYIKENGNEVNPDLMRPMFKEYKGYNVTDYDRFAGALTEITYDHLLATKQGQGNNTVLMTAGGPGSAKSSILNNPEIYKNKKDYPVILDTTLSSKNALKAIDKALKKGYEVQMLYVLRDPVDAWKEGVLPRTKNIGRVVTEGYFLKSHENARKNIIAAYDKYKNNSSVDFVFFDNTQGAGNAKLATIDDIRNFDYNVDQTKEEITKSTQTAYEKQDLTKEQYEAITKDRESLISSAASEGTQQLSEKQSKDELKLSPLDQIREALFNGDLNQAEQLHQEYSKTEKLPTLAELEDEILQQQMQEIDGIKEELGDVENLPVDHPNRVLVEIADKIVQHFKAPGALFKVTGKKRTYTMPDGTSLEVGGTSTESFDRMIFSTDIDGFSKNIAVLAYKFNKTFTSISDRIRKGDIDSSDYEKFKDQFRKLIQERPAYAGGSSTALKSLSQVKSQRDSSETIKDTSSTSSTNLKYDYQSTQLNLPKSLADKVISFGNSIAKSDLSINEADNRFGVEKQPHITVLYGLDNKITEKQISKILGNVGSIDVELGKTSIFSNDEYDVLKIDVKGESLVKVNELLNKSFDTPGQTFKDYSPHITIAYLEKGAGAKYVGDTTFEGEKVKFNDLYFSRNDGTQIKVGLNEQKQNILSLSAKDTQKIDNFELRSPPKPGTEEFKLHKKVVELIRKYTKTIGEGYLPRRALGVYYTETKNIRVNTLNNLSVVAHEVAHFLDYANNITNGVDDSLANQLGAVYLEYYPGAKADHPSKLQILEGFATLLQKYVEMPMTITEKYPGLVKDFFTEGGAKFTPVIKEVLTDLNNIVGEYQGLSSLDKIGARVTSDATNINKPSFMNFFDMVRTQIADRVYPIEVLAKKSGRHMTKIDPSLWVRAYNSVNGIINNNISTDRGYWAFTDLQNGFQKKHPFNWKTLIDSTQQRGVTDSFSHYLVARRQYFEYQELDRLKAQRDKLEQFNNEIQGLMTKEDVENMNRDTKASLSEDYGIDISESKLEAIKRKVKRLFDSAEKMYLDLQGVLDKDAFDRTEVENAYKENKLRFKDEERMFDILSQEDLALLHNEDVQLVDKKTFSRLKSREGYASFKREFYDEIVGDSEFVGGVSVGSTKVSSMMSRKGSGRTIINPLFSALLNHNEIVRKAMKQVVYNQFGNLGTSALMPNLFQETQVKINVDKTTGKISYPQEKDRNIIMARKEYKRVAILTDNKVKGIIDNLLTYKNVDVFSQLYMGASRMFTAGTTGFYPQFAVSNFVVDQITAMTNSYNKFIPLFSPISAMKTAMFKRFGSNSPEVKFYEEYLVMGGERQTFSGWQKLPPKDLFKKIKGEMSLMNNAISIVQKGGDLFSYPSAKSELFSRAVEYINSRKAGKSQVVALEEAGRVTAPFHHIGEWGNGMFQTYIRGLPFFNAGIQFLDQSLRVAETGSGKARMTFTTLVITAAAISSLLQLKDATDEQKEQYKDLEAEDLVNYIYFPHPSGEDLIRIKMANLYSIPGTLINMIIANRIFGAKNTTRDMIEASTAFLPDQFNVTDPVKMVLGWIPQVFKPVSHIIFNVKEYPTVTNLVSMGLKDKPAPLQYNESTSEFAKKLGEMFNLSPIKIDYFLTGYLGRASGFLTGKPGIYNPSSSIIRDYYFTMGKRVREFYDTKEQNDKNYRALQNAEKGFDNLDRDEYLEIYRKKIITDSMDDLLREYRDLDANKNQERMAEIRATFFTYIEKLEDGSKPKGFNKWVFDAEKRRKEKLKDAEKSPKKTKKIF